MLGGGDKENILNKTDNEINYNQSGSKPPLIPLKKLLGSKRSQKIKSRSLVKNSSLAYPKEDDKENGFKT